MEQAAPPISPVVVMFGIIWLLIIAAGLCYGWLWLVSKWQSRPQRLSTVSSADYVEQEADEAADEAADDVSALFEAARRLQVDRTRGAIIDTLLLAGWEPGAVRGAVRGDNNVVQAEINAARVRLGLKEAPRTIPMRDSNGTREVAI